MKKLLNKFKKEILEHNDGENYKSLIQTIDLELYKIKQKEETEKLNLKEHMLKIEIESMENFVEVQELAFLLNCGWHYGSSKPVKRLSEHDIAPSFVFIGKYLTVGYKDDKIYFDNHAYKQVTLKELEVITDGLTNNIIKG